MHVLSIIVMFAISAGILLAAQSGCIGASLAGTDGSYDTPDIDLFEHAPVQEVTAGERMSNLIVACQIADTFADMFFTGVLDAAYAVHAVLSLTAVDNITDDNSSLRLNGARGITTFVSDGHTYAAIASFDDNGVQILNITNPSNITATDSIRDAGSLELNSARGITTFVLGGHTYAAVAALRDNGVQILNVTDPSNIIAAGHITDTPSLELEGAADITTFVSDGHTYAAVAANIDNGVQILDVTNPPNIIVAGNITGAGTSTDSLELWGARGIAIFESGGHKYAAVAAYSDNGVQILNVTDPSNITAAGSITDTSNLELAGATSITTFKSGGHTYAAVAAHIDDGVQILDVTNPPNIIAAGHIVNTPSLNLNGAQDITTFKSGGHTYAAVAAYSDNGVQILDVTNLPNIIAAGNIAGNGTDTDSLELWRSFGIAIFESDVHTYAAVAAAEDNGVQIIRIDIPESDTIPADAFATTWTVSAGQNITINFVGDDINIDWGDDGTTETDVDGPRTHIYTDAGNYTVSVTGGLTGLTLDRPPNFIDLPGPVPEIASIDQWGGISWTNMSNAFAGASNMVYNAIDTPDLSLVTDMSSMFASATAFDGDLSSWDVSFVTDMSGMFLIATAFDGDLSGWDVSSVTDMSFMFATAASFNGTISSWDVSSVTDMSDMFQGTTSFDQPLNTWDVSSVTDMNEMFRDAASFDRPLNDWDVSSVNSMFNMFQGTTSFDRPLNDWDVSSVTDMNDMFSEAASFNQTLNDWDVSSVTDMSYMFVDATSFNRPLNAWDISSVTNMEEMFLGATAFDQDLSGWYVVQDTPVLTANAMFPIRAQNSYLDGLMFAYSIDDTRFVMDGKTLSLNSTNLPPAGMYPLDITAPAVLGEPNAGEEGHTRTLIVTVKENRPFITTWRTTSSNQEISINFVGSGINIDWGDGTATDTGVSVPQTHIYTDAGNYTVSVTGGLTGLTLDRPDDSAGRLVPELASIDQWGGISWTNMSNAFAGASNMTYSATDTPDLRLVTDMSFMFNDATAFDGDLSSWDVSYVTDMRSMFLDATAFNGNLSSWDVSSVTDMYSMFRDATAFNGNLSSWDVSSVTDMYSMFRDATAFDQPINDWDVSKVTDMGVMFAGATAFDQPINDWDVSKVIDMNVMFAGATAFNRPLNAWDVSSVTFMNGMFLSASAFKQPLNAWDVSSVTDMNGMFTLASAFDQPLNAWDVSSVTRMSFMFQGATAFDQPLNTWDVSKVTEMGGMFIGASAFDQPLNAWDVSSVTSMSFMFNNATSFNQPLGTWDVSSVTSMVDMFSGATDFDQNLSGWYVVQDRPPVLTANAMFSIRAQNSYLDNLVSTYSIDDTRFVMNDKTLSLNSTNLPPAGIYPLDITAPAVLGEPDARDEGHTRTLIVTVKGEHLPFITTWRTTLPNQEITINFVGSGMNISWGDGMTETNVSGTQSHTYATAGDYRVSVTGALTGLTLDRPDVFGNLVGLVPELASIDQWGGISWTNMSNAFAGASNMTYTATDTPDLRLVTDMHRMFETATAFDGDLSSWDVSSVTDMAYMFSSATSFNQPLNAWDVSSVTDMTYMFGSATSFNRPLNDWDVSSVTDMFGMFFAASSFDRPLNDWDVSSVRGMRGMFFNAISFDQPLHAWDVSSVSIMHSMFSAAILFDRPLNAWDVSSVTDMYGMFHDTYSFNQPLHAWDVSKVADMSTMFKSARDFNHPLNDWDVSSVTHMAEMFEGASSFNKDLSSWYITPESAVLITDHSRTLTVMPLSPYIGEQSPVYTVNDARFVMNGRTLSLNSANTPTADIYDLDITATAVLDEPNTSTHTRTVAITVRDPSTVPFITTWRTDSANQTITIPVGGSTARYSIDWGDNSPVETDITGDSTHTYAEAGIYTVSISGGLERIYLDGQQPNAGRLASIEQWGDMYWTSMRGAFDGAYNMVYNAAAAPDLGLVSDTSRMFAGAAAFDGEISEWDVSAVRDMSRMFAGAAAFDGEISEWDVSAVRDMSRMFAGAAAFDGEISEWDVSAVRDISGMFDGATSFNHLLNSWNVSSVRDMSGMFDGATSFDQPLNSWNVSSVRDMSSIFDGATSFDRPLDDWDVSSTTDMTRMFAGATSFNRPLDGWDISAATGMSGMFAGATAFDQDLSGWYVTLDGPAVIIPGYPRTPKVLPLSPYLDGHLHTYSVNDPQFVVAGRTLLLADPDSPPPTGDYSLAITTAAILGEPNTDSHMGTFEITVKDPVVRPFITTWNTDSDNQTITIPGTGQGHTCNIDWGDGTVHRDTSCRQTHTYAANGTHTVSISGGLERFHLDGQQPNADRLASIEQWGDIYWTSMRGAFNGASNMVYNATDAPDLSRVSDMSNMFAYATSFNGDLSSWDVSKVTDMSDMFFFVTSFNGDLSSWDVSNVTDMSNMLAFAYDFNGNLSSWDVLAVTDMSHMFEAADSFNGDLSSWNVSNVTDMSSMFALAIKFNQPLNSWNVSSVRDMSGMFDGATSFDRPLNNWNVSKVTNMGSMFLSAELFNQSLNNWNVSAVTSMNRMFHSTSSFNQTISSWDVSAVTDMHRMFYDASDFNQPLNAWNVSKVTSMASMFYGASDFNQPLNDWNVSKVTSMDDMFFDTSFSQNLGNWYVTLDSTEIDLDGDGRVVGAISVQNSYLDRHSPTYGIGDGTYSDLFVVNSTGKTLELNTDANPPFGVYEANITSTGSFGTDNHRVLNVTVTGGTPVLEDVMLVDIEPQSVNELVALSFTVMASGGDGDLTFLLASGHPAGATINSITGVFSWTPTESQDGIHDITIQVRDGIGTTASENIEVTVGEVNLAPTLNPIGSKSANQLVAFTFAVSALDDDIINGTADTLRFSMTGAPTGASINQNTGVFSWTPTASQTGMHTITFQVADGIGATASEDVTITVGGSNENPMLNPIGSQSVNEGATLLFTATATDGDGDSLTFSLVGSPPTGASINSTTGAFSWTPTERQDGDSSITVRVSDGNGGTDSKAVTVTVREVNVAPMLDFIGQQGVNRPGTLTFTATASDDDFIGVRADALTFSLETGFPSGASITSAGAFTWMPAADQTGTHIITVIVTDGAGASDSEAVEVRVTEGGTNTAPVLDPIEPQSVDELDTLEFTATASDADGDSLRFSLVGSPPTGASINLDTGVFSWTPDQSQNGDYSITVQVSDGRGGTDSEVVNVTVHDIAPLPVSARASSSSAITLTLSEIVTSSGTGPNGFSVTTGGDPVSVESITGSGTTTLVLGLTGSVSSPATLSYSGGDVSDEDGNALESFEDLDVLFPSQRRGGTTPPAVDLGTLAYQRLADIPPHIAEQVASHDASDPLEPVMPDDTFDLPLVIDGRGYLLDDLINTLVLQTVTTGDGPVIITFTVYTQKDLAHFALYLNLKDENTDYADSDTRITYRDDDTTVVTDPHGYIGDNSTITVTQEDDQVPEKKTVRITVEFEEPMGPANMVAYMWNTDRKATFIKIIDAFEVAASAVLQEPVMQKADPEPVLPDSEMPADPEPVVPYSELPADPEPVPRDTPWPDDYDDAQVLTLIRMWSGFEPESITDAQLIDLLGLEDYRGADLPDWMMTELGVLVARDAVTVDEFMLALQYVLEHA